MTVYSKLLLFHIVTATIIAAMMRATLASRNLLKDDILLYFGLIAALFFILDFTVGFVLLFSKNKQRAYNLLFCAVTMLLIGFISLSSTRFSIGF